RRRGRRFHLRARCRHSALQGGDARQPRFAQRTGGRCAGPRALLRRTGGLPAEHRQRPHPRLMQPALQPAVSTRWHVSAAREPRTGVRRRRDRPGQTGRHYLRRRRHRGGAAVRAAFARQGGRRFVRRQLERMGRRPGHAEGTGVGRLSEEDESRRPAARVVEAGRREEWTGAVVNPPVWRATTHLYADSADLAKGRPNEDGQFYYGRRGAPTQWALADALSGLERGAAGTVLYP